MSINIEPYIRDIPDFPKPGIIFKDITPLLLNPDAYGLVIDHLAERYTGKGIQKILGIESRGFIFGATLADRMKAGFVPLRKPGKLPADTISQSYELEYGEATIEIHRDALAEGERVLVIDDLLATGGTLSAACSLAQQLGADIAEIAVMIELCFLNGRDKLPPDIPFYSIMKVD